MAEFKKPELNEVVAQGPKTVGDEEVQKHVHELDPQVNTEPVKAQVTPDPDPPASTVNVHETYLELDHVITDPSDPLAVQVPDAGRGSLDLPIHTIVGPTVEEVFAKEAASIEERDADAPAPGDAAAPNPDAHGDE